MNNPNKIIVHHSAVSRKRQRFQFLPINNYHRTALDKNGNWLYHYGKPTSMGYYGAYHILIEPNGMEFRYRKDHEVGAHTKGQNDTSLAVCLAGNFDFELPTVAQIKTLKKRLHKWMLRYGIEDVTIFPHREFSEKTCYGRLLSDEWASQLTTPAELIKNDEDRNKEAKIQELAGKLNLLKTLLLKLSILLAKLAKK